MIIRKGKKGDILPAFVTFYYSAAQAKREHSIGRHLIKVGKHWREYTETQVEYDKPTYEDAVQVTVKEPHQIHTRISYTDETLDKIETTVKAAMLHQGLVIEHAAV